MRRIALGALAMIAVLACAAPAHAQTADDLALLPSADAPLDTKTGAVKVAVQPGGGVWQSAMLTNRSGVRFSVALAGAGDDGVASWIQPAIDTLLLEPGKSQTIDFTIAPPPDAAHDAVASLVATAVENPEITKRIDVIVELIGEPVAATPAASAAVGASPTAPDEMKPARPQGNKTADTILLIAIVVSLAVLAAALVVPAVVAGRRKVRPRVVRSTDRSAPDRATPNRAAPNRVPSEPPVPDRLAAERLAERELLRSVLGASPPVPSRRQRRETLDVAALNQELTRRG